MELFNLELSSTFLYWFTPISTSYALIFLAEMGDKSQLVCMTLAARSRAMPVIFGAITAFALLNTLAVLFGVAIASWIPDYIVATIVCLLFTVFGYQTLFFNNHIKDEDFKEKSSHNLFLTTFLLITVAEFGDKTQLAVVALSSTALPSAIWVGSTLALATTSSLGVLAGRTILQRIPLRLIHRLVGTIFMILACFAAYQAYSEFYAVFPSVSEFIKTLK